MSADRNQLTPNSLQREPLPGEFDVRQIAVDRMLARAADADARNVPAGLSQRVFEMTVGSLPTPVAGDVQPRLRLVETHAHSARREYVWSIASWGRFAMAASVTVVAGVALWTTWPTHTPTAPMAQGNGNGSEGGGAGRAAAPEIRTASVDLTDLNRFDASNPSVIDAYESTFSYLLDASEVRSFEDLNTDLRLFVAQLEM